MSEIARNLENKDIHASMINLDRANALIEEIEDEQNRLAIRLLMEGVKQFYEDHPGDLKSPFDAAFFVQILGEIIVAIRSDLDGSIPIEYWFDDYPFEVSVDDPENDVSKDGLRGKQANNYAVRCTHRRIQSVLLRVSTRAYIRQDTYKERRTGKELIAIHPQAPFDYLFAFMAVDFALQPGGPAHYLLL